MYASFLNLPVAGRHSRALHLKLFAVPSALRTFFEIIKKIRAVKNRECQDNPRCFTAFS
jgi:hypothetical protein